MAESDRERWDEKYRHGEHCGRSPAPELVALASHLPQQGRALDVAGGAGRNAIWLAQQGLRVRLVDISSIGAEIARQRALESGVQLETESRDVEETGLPAGPWDLVVTVDFLYRPLFESVENMLPPSGRLVVVHPTVTNLERHTRPSRRFCLKPGELAQLLSRLEIVFYKETWCQDDRHLAVAVAGPRP